MKITCFFIGWNIQDTIHLTVKHYQSFCSKIVYYDNWSTDASREIAESMGVTVKLFGQPGFLDDKAYLDVKKNVWKGDEADLVIVVDDDEIVLPTFGPGPTIYQCQGYGMYSNEMPREKWTEIMTGVEDEQYSKFAVFSPKAIREIGYVYGCHGHQTKPEGKLFYGERIPLLHYRSVGGVERLIKRHEMYNKKERGAENIRWSLASHYHESNEHKRTYFADRLKNSRTLSFPSIGL